MGHRAFAWFYEKAAPRADARGIAARRQELLSSARGFVVEIGAGTGLNLRWYPSAVTEVLLTEPDPHMFRRLERALASAEVPARLQLTEADRIPVGDSTVDTMVSSLVLCSVPSVGSALAEAARVLKPDGRLLFFEHVRSERSRFARMQDLFERPWGWVGGGCHPNRHTVAAIEIAGFKIQSLRRFDEPGSFLARPHVIGEAVRAR